MNKLQLYLLGDRAVDMAPQQVPLSGVIICPTVAEGQRLRVNSFTATQDSIAREEWGCQRKTASGVDLICHVEADGS
jgi:hypothetical protein